MKRIVLLSSLVTSAVSVPMTAVAMLLVLPTIVDAQVARTTAQGLTVIRPDGMPGMTADVQASDGGVVEILGSDGKAQRVSLAARGVGARVQLHDQSGANRVNLALGGESGTNPGAEGLNMDDSSGVQLVRLGTRAPGSGIRVVMLLTDQQDNPRIQMSVADDGTPSIKMLDANGNVMWTAE
jgi:hypothetical protein